MVETTDTREPTEFPIYRHDWPPYDTAEARIEVSRFGTIYPASGQGCVDKGQTVVAYGRTGQELGREKLLGHGRMDHTVRNNLGDLGAVVDDPPTEEEIEAAVERMRRRLVAEENLLAKAPPERAGWTPWVYETYQPPYPDAPGRQAKLVTSMRDSDGEAFSVIGRGDCWTVYTNSMSPAGGYFYGGDILFKTAAAAQAAVERETR